MPVYNLSILRYFRLKIKFCLQTMYNIVEFHPTSCEIDLRNDQVGFKK